MGDNLTVFNTNYTNVTGIKAKGTGNGMLTYIRPAGTKLITSNGTDIDVTNYVAVSVDVQDSGIDGDDLAYGGAYVGTAIVGSAMTM